MAQPKREPSLGLGALHQSQLGASADITRTSRSFTEKMGALLHGIG